MANDLHSLDIREVAFCERGMNKNAKIALFKADDDAPGASGFTKAEEAESDAVFVESVAKIAGRGEHDANLALTICKLAYLSPADAAEKVSPAEIVKAQRALADYLRRDGETVEAARSRTWGTDIGKRLLAAFDIAKATPAGQAAPTEHSIGNAHMRELHNLAYSIRSTNPKTFPTDSHARNEARRQRPDLAQAERDWQKSLRA